jgi:hypothetical protein
MPLSWNEIRHRAIAFSKEGLGAKSEQAEKQTFWNEFFDGMFVTSVMLPWVLSWGQQVFRGKHVVIDSKRRRPNSQSAINAIRRCVGTRIR